NKLKPFIESPFRKKTEIFVMRELRNHAIRSSLHAIDPGSAGFIPGPFKKKLAAASPGNSCPKWGIIRQRNGSVTR
ncbi:MAG: hypothetical protein MUF25_22440, partial [Pirellulaceae bacterium]|nr:hypothetical protein [Pirellulaceae bacterium]